MIQKKYNSEWERTLRENRPGALFLAAFLYDKLSFLQHGNMSYEPGWETDCFISDISGNQEVF